jgi:hypothetical protein
VSAIGTSVPKGVARWVVRPDKPRRADRLLGPGGWPDFAWRRTLRAVLRATRAVWIWRTSRILRRRGSGPATLPDRGGDDA